MDSFYVGTITVDMRLYETYEIQKKHTYMIQRDIEKYGLTEYYSLGEFLFDFKTILPTPSPQFEFLAAKIDAACDYRSDKYSPAEQSEHKKQENSRPAMQISRDEGWFGWLVSMMIGL